MTSFAIFGRQGHLPALSRIQRFCLALLLLCMTGLALPAMAQPVVGSTYKDFLPMGGGASVALPEGTWLYSHNSTNTRPGYTWETYTLRNKQADDRIPFLVVRQATGSVRWGNTGCQSSSTQHFILNQHGTLANQLINKCSRFFAMGNFDVWRNVSSWSNPNDKEWWIDAVKGFDEHDKSFKSSMFLAELSVQQFNGKGLRVEAFILPPKGTGAIRFRDAVKAGEPRPEQTMLDTWASIYIESMQQSYFNKKPQPIMALAYPVNTGGSNAPAQAVPAMAQPPVVAAAPKPEPAAVKLPSVPAALPAPTPVVAAAPAAVPKAEATPVKPAPVAAAPVAVPSAIPMVADNAAQIKLDQERRALDEEKRKMNQQLELMNQMLAKLQQENATATAAAAAKAKELAAAPAPVAAKEPVTYANRKALVIGNDLYKHVSKLNNAAADAEAMAKSLESVGYKVFKHLNLDEKKFKQAVRDFRQNLTGGDEVLFFYAGHGVQLGNANYLLPIDVQGDHEDQVKDDAILLQKVLDDLEEKKTKFALAVIDACRDNPFKGKGRAVGGRGLAPTSAATGQMIMFSAGSGQQALDRLGDNDKEKNGLFTRIFVKEMTKPGLSVDRVLRNVRTEVVRLARSVGHEQTPALYDQAIGEFYFKQ
ncbi:caspase family protein [Limnohabitans sp. 15K]|uniref:caspase family protein n=1 Tax=Limnohabitans sp. 15K TaxID=1100706 RepID=UPI000C1E2886|nr:caspase family protein [Limnohabitans sp. 15K]